MSLLYEPFQLTKNLRLKNRLFMCPMGFTKDLDGGISERQIRYLAERAKGGFGMVFPSAHVISEVVEPSGNGGGNYLTTTHHAERLAYAVEQVHNYGAKFALQLSPGLGRVSTAHPSLFQMVSASEVPTWQYPKYMCRAMTVEEIKQILADTTKAARFARNAGVDVLEIHAYGGYLLDQFMTPLWNHRTDEYGGSLENRLRFVFEMRDAIRKAVGPDFPLGIKYTPQHDIPGGRTFEDEGIEIAKILDEAGFDFIHLDHGCYEVWNKAVTTSYEPAGCQLFMAERLKAEGIKTPLLVQGKLNNPVDAERVVNTGLAQMVGLGHQSIADPYWPIKAKRGNYDDIIHCIGCNECVFTAGLNKPRTCALNPNTGYEGERKPLKAEIKRKLLVVGAGPAGMYAATVAANAGHDVELWEKTDRLGGLLNAAGAPSFKFDTKKYLEHLKVQLHKSSARVRMCREATVENILAYAPGAVLVAAGGYRVKPPIPGIDGDNVLEAVDMLMNERPTGQHVVLIGGGEVGCEAALDLAYKGKDVTLIELMPRLLKLAKSSINMKYGLLQRIEASTMDVKTGCAVTEILPDGVRYKDAQGEIQELACDTVVYAVGFRSEHSMAEELEKQGLTVLQLGDYIEPHKVITAVHTGYHAVELIEDHLAYNM